MRGHLWATHSLFTLLVSLCTCGGLANFTATYSPFFIYIITFSLNSLIVYFLPLYIEILPNTYFIFILLYYCFVHKLNMVYLPY